MSGPDLILLLLRLAGGLGLFLFALAIMSDGLRRHAGAQLRWLLRKATRHRTGGMLFGALLGFLLHSSATTTMLVGIVQAGLLTLAEAVPPILGANLGSTLSMQLISFRVAEFWYAPLIPAAALLLSGRDAWRPPALLLAGFGLMFLGMATMSQAVLPHRDLLTPWIAHLDASAPSGLALGFIASLAVTLALQSSGATIGLCFALIQAGVFTQLTQVMPIVLGAHVGTCATALLASVGTSLEARRTALSHLLFNLVGVVLTLAAWPLFARLLPLLSHDLLRQTAHFHTASMLLSVLVLLPVSPWFARAVAFLVRSDRPQPEGTHLDEKLLDRPEQALLATLRELQRVARISARGFHLNGRLIFAADARVVRALKMQEDAVDEIERAMKSYLLALTARRLSRRQAILIQHLNRCMIDIERIGDHNDNLCNLSVSRHRQASARLPREALEALFELFHAADRVLQLVIASLDPNREEFQSTARQILEARDAYVELSLTTKSRFLDKVASHEYSPVAGMYLSEYTASFDRIVRHAKMIAMAESHPHFWIKRQKLERVAPERPELDIAEDGRDFLEKLQTEGYV